MSMPLNRNSLQKSFSSSMWKKACAEKSAGTEWRYSWSDAKLESHQLGWCVEVHWQSCPVELRIHTSVTRVYLIVRRCQVYAMCMKPSALCAKVGYE